MYLLADNYLVEFMSDVGLCYGRGPYLAGASEGMLSSMHFLLLFFNLILLVVLNRTRLWPWGGGQT